MEESSGSSEKKQEVKKKGKASAMQNKIAALASSISQHDQTLEKLKDLPGKMDTLLEALSAGMDSSDSASVADKNDSEDDLIQKLRATANNEPDTNAESPDDDLLVILNLTQPVQEVGPDLQKDVAESISRLFTQRPPKESMEKLKEKYKIPNNCRTMGVPKVNTEIWSLLPQRTRQNDFSQQIQQQGVALSSSILSKISETIFTTKEPLSKALKEDLLKMTLDAEMVLGSLNQEISQKRRVDIKPILNKDVAGICNLPIVHGDWLFGDNMAEQLKNTKAAANVIRSTIRPFRKNFRYSPYSNTQRGSFNNNLNWRAPPPAQNRGGFNQRFQGRMNHRGASKFQRFQRN